MANNYLAPYCSYYTNQCQKQCCDPYQNQCCSTCPLGQGNSYQNQCYNPCPIKIQPCILSCPNICAAPCPAPCPPLPLNVIYATSAPTVTIIPTGGTSIPAGSTIVPATITVVTGFSPVPTTNLGGITLNPVNGQFTVPVAGRYTITGTDTFTTNSLTGNITLYIYRIDVTNNVISLLAANAITVVPVSTSTSNTVTTIADLNAGDRIFYAVTQNTGANISTSAVDNRFVIALTRAC